MSHNYYSLHNFVDHKIVAGPGPPHYWTRSFFSGWTWSTDCAIEGSGSYTCWTWSKG